MVDTTDSKSVASNRVRVQVSSPVNFIRSFRSAKRPFLILNKSSSSRLELSRDKSRSEPNGGRF